MRLAHVIDSLSDSGGAEHGLVREITRFNGEHEQVVFALYRNAALANQLQEADIQVEVLGWNPSVGARMLPFVAAQLRRRIRSFQPDLIHSSLFMGNLSAQLAGRSLGIPVVSTFALSGDRALLRSFQPGASSMRAEFLRRVGGVAARHELITFRALTEDARRTNAALLRISPDKVTVIPRGVPERLVSSPRPSRSDLGLPDDRPLVVNVGRHTAQKGHAHLIRAFERIQQETGAHLVMCGREGDTYVSTKALIDELELTPHVTIMGQTPLVHDVVAAADVFVFSSVMEGLGTAVIEAMAIGTPVVAFDIPAVREATNNGEFAILVPIGDEAGLAAASVGVIDGLGGDLAQRAREFVIADRSAVAIAGRLEALLLKKLAPQESG